MEKTIVSAFRLISIAFGCMMFCVVIVLSFARHEATNQSVISLLMRGQDRQGVDLYQLRIDGTTIRRFFDLDIPTSALGWSPDGYSNRPLSWSPDGKRFSFGANTCGVPDCQSVYRSGLNDSQFEQISSLDSPAWQPAWSPDSDWIVFISTAGDLDSLYSVQLFKMRPDGTSRQQVTTMPHGAFHPEWSPDGKWIAFSSLPSPETSNRDIYIVRSDGSELRHLTTLPSAEILPVWSPPRQERGVWRLPCRSGFWQKAAISNVPARFAAFCRDAATSAKQRSPRLN
jgi:dipeptidyl aminopeptidase/acylaminoacyl peptidase